MITNIDANNGAEIICVFDEDVNRDLNSWVNIAFNIIADSAWGDDYGICSIDGKVDGTFTIDEMNGVKPWSANNEGNYYIKFVLFDELPPKEQFAFRMTGKINANTSRR